MATWEIINPSDKYTIGGDDFAAAAAVTLFLGEGKYSLRPIEGTDQEMPFFMFGGEDAVDTWFKGISGETFSQFIRNHPDRMAAAAESVVIGDRDLYRETLAMMLPERIEEFTAKWNDRHRSSTNDIGGRASRLTKRFRELAAVAKEPTS